MMRWMYAGFAAALIVGLALIVIARGGPPAAGRADTGDARLVAQGQIVYAQYCAACHGANLEGQANWQLELPEGGRPAPPHDATGHTWHHADDLLFAIVKGGPAAVTTPGYVYRMPAFGATLSDDEIWAVLAYIKSTWPPEIQSAQEQISRQAQ